MQRGLFRTLSLACLLAVAGCAGAKRPPVPGATTTPTPHALVPIESGFLADYRPLMPTGQFPDLRIYRDTTQKTVYHKLLIRPVEIWRSADSRLDDVPEEDLQYLADALYRSISRHLRRNFRIVDRPGPGVLEIRLAFTLVTRDRGRIDYFSTDVPVPKLAARRGPLNPDTEKFIRACAMEAEFAETKPLVRGGRGRPASEPTHLVRAAVFDRRRGSETSKGQVETWEDVQAVFDRWGALIDEKIASAPRVASR